MADSSGLPGPNDKVVFLLSTLPHPPPKLQSWFRTRSNDNEEIWRGRRRQYRTVGSGVSVVLSRLARLARLSLWLSYAHAPHPVFAKILVLLLLPCDYRCTEKHRQRATYWSMMLPLETPLSLSCSYPRVHGASTFLASGSVTVWVVLGCFLLVLAFFWTSFFSDLFDLHQERLLIGPKSAKISDSEQSAMSPTKPQSLDYLTQRVGTVPCTQISHTDTDTQWVLSPQGLIEPRANRNRRNPQHPLSRNFAPQVWARTEYSRGKE